MSDDSIAVSAVSRSRISPTMITSGSARIIERRPAAKSSPVFELTWICFMPAIRTSTGSSIVMIVFSGLWISPSAE